MLLPTYSLDGDEEFDAVVGRWAGPVLAAARRQLGDEAAAREATAVVLLALQTAGGQVAPAARADWLFAATRNVCWNLVQSRALAARQNRPPSAPPLPAQIDWPRSALDEAIAALRADDRRAIVGRFVAERSPKELAASLGVEESIATARVERAVDRLRRRGIEASELAALPGGAVDAAFVEEIVDSAARATPAVASRAETFATSAPPAHRSGRWVLVGAVAGLALVLLIGAVAWNASLPPAPPPMPAAPVVVAPRADADSPEMLASRGALDSALRKLAEEIAAIDPGAGRDRRDFGPIISASRADVVLDAATMQRRAMYSGRGMSVTTQGVVYRSEERDALRRAANLLLGDIARDRAIVDWRAHRLLARLDQLDQQQDARRRSLEAAIQAYPAIEYADPPTQSSLHDLYGELAAEVARERGDAAALALLLNAVKRDPRFAYVDTVPWEASPAYPAFAEQLARAYEAKAKADPAHRERNLEYAAETRSRAKR